MARTNKIKKTPRVAIVHDWLVGGGAERVILELHRMYPDAPIYTSYCTPEWRDRLDRKVVTGFLQHWPFGKLRKIMGLPRMWWFSHLDLSSYDVVIVSTGNGEAIGARPREDAVHIVYCHAPTHYYWRHYEQYLKSPGMGLLNPLVRFGLRLLAGPMRKWNFNAAQRGQFVANSMHTQAEIACFYKRKSVVVHPPIDIERFEHVPAVKRNGFVTAGRQTPYKHTDLIVQACTRLNVPLTVIGRGPDHEKLVRLAGPTVRFPENVTDEQMGTYFNSAQAFLFAAYEDFGVTPVEAMAAGTPVVAYRNGGALDYVQEGKTGMFFAEQSVESLVQALKNFDASRFDHSVIRTKAEQFSPQVFTRKMQEIVEKHLPN